jgi:hypothetical protein
MRNLLALLVSGTIAASCLGPSHAQQVTVRFDPKAASTPLDGRLLILFSNDPSDEPRNQIDDTPKTQQVFGITVDHWQPGAPITLTEAATGYPHTQWSRLPPGDYTVQAVLNRYQTFHRADGKTVKLPPDMGEGQHWNIKPGNLYSLPRKVHIDPSSTQTLDLALTQTIPPIQPIADTKYIRHLHIQSQILTRFWGAPIFLDAVVMVPAGFDDHPSAHYPLMIFEDHFAEGFMDFRETPPDPNLKPDYSERFHLAGYNRIQQQEAYKNFQDWTRPNRPRFLIVKLNHANPFYDDSYAVNSANVGPYGDAIETELIPAIEQKFRGIGQGWARFVYGGSTGGWESLAVQMFYPDHYNGAFVACPDPVDFHAYGIDNLYQQPNMYYLQGAQKRVEQPSMRDYLGHTLITVRDNVQYEAALGDSGRSGDQYDIWQAVFSPTAADGYPQQIFDKSTGAINKDTVAWWHDHYDLNAILQRDWPTLGPKLQGKIHLYVGADDTYFLNDAVYLMEDFLKTTGTPGHGVPYEGEVKYGPRAEHCWNGDPDHPNWYSRLHYNQMYVPKIMDRIKSTAPSGADLTSWVY